MKLLFDENLSDRILPKIIGFYPDSVHVKTFGLTNTDDAEIWEYAKTNIFVIVSKKSDLLTKFTLRLSSPIYLSPSWQLLNI
ncbi:DUF5615 family PIN-like protein [Microcoleus sp. N9_B4]|uniref:DUF5615 family PIN-like protein n=1 Tax=Microcoleus sp. N9_B4 TaxID=3055386 RepID=UPI002FD1889E